jgi:hypothetical protein
MFLLSGYRDMPGVLARARSAGVERVVLLSGGAAVAVDTGSPISQYMIRSEEAVREAGSDWTILRPYEFMSNSLRWSAQVRSGDVVRAPFADVSVAVIDPRDIAETAVTALVDGGHEGECYRLSGPQSLLPEERVRMLAAALERGLRFEAQSDDEARAEMSTSMPPEYVEAFIRFYVDGWVDESFVLATVEDITGRKPGTFEQWLSTTSRPFAEQEGRTQCMCLSREPREPWADPGLPADRRRPCRHGHDPYPGQPMSLRCWEGLCWSAEDDRRKDQAWDRQ